MVSLDDLLDDVFHGCAFAAFVEVAVRAQTWPDSETVRRRAFESYEEWLAVKNARAGSGTGEFACNPPDAMVR